MRRAAGDPLTIRAATLAAAAAAAGLALERGMAVEVNGEPAGDDPGYPLADGDSLVFGI